MHIHGVGNVERMYNLYQGTKFYHGGIANPIDYEAEKISGGTGWGWKEGLDRAEADVIRHYRPGTEVHIVGWSRGAAMAVELARRLQARGIPVAFLGLFDPVYSHGMPGQDSNYVISTKEGRDGNYVTTTMPTNVRVAVVVYAMNELRSWFAATRFLENGSTRIINSGSPGGHGEAGGHWQSNMNIQQLNLRAMVEYARGHGNAPLAYRGIDADLQAFFNSTYSQSIARSIATKSVPFRQYREAWRPEHWSPYSRDEFVRMANSTNHLHWRPSAAGAQRNDGWNEAKTIPILIMPFNGWIQSRNQSWSDHYPRRLPWVDHGLYDIYPGIDRRNIRRFYELRMDPESGGWQP